MITFGVDLGALFIHVQDEQFELEELKATIDVLNNLNSKCSLAGPVCDCVVFNDGGTWWYVSLSTLQLYALCWWSPLIFPRKGYGVFLLYPAGIYTHSYPRKSVLNSLPAGSTINYKPSEDVFC